MSWTSRAAGCRWWCGRGCCGWSRGRGWRTRVCRTGCRCPRPRRWPGSSHRCAWAAGDDDEPLLANLDFTDLLNLGDAGAVDVARTWRPRSAAERLRVPIGVGEDGEPVMLDLKEAAQEGMGPHGLCVGATGSGKSELLRTLVLGLAVTHSSETLNFVLADFKGGATFAGMSHMPHVAAVITNLADDLTLVDRMRDSIRGELQRRQELLRSAGNYANIHDYEKARAAGARAGAAGLAGPGHRRVLRTADRQAGLHRHVHPDRPHRPVAGCAPAAGLAAPGGGQAARSGHLPVVPDRSADLLGRRVAYGARRAGRLPPAVGAGFRLSASSVRTR